MQNQNIINLTFTLIINKIEKITIDLHNERNRRKNPLKKPHLPIIVIYN